MSFCLWRSAVKQLTLNYHKVVAFPKAHATTLRQGEKEELLQTYADFKKFLRNNKIQYKDGHTCLQLECRLCNCSGASQPAPEKPTAIGGTASKTAFINKRTGTFLCPHCDVSRPLAQTLEAYESGKKSPQVTVIDYQSTHTATSKVPQSVCERLQLRDLKVADLALMGAEYAASTDTLHVPLRNAANHKVGEKILNVATRHEETHQTSTNSGLLIHGSGKAQRAILVTNILDFLVLSTQRLDNHHIVCLPYFLKSLPLECLPTLERYKELVFWFDFDSTGWDTTKIFANKIGETRCFLIRPTENEPSPYRAHQRHLNLRQILQRALPVLHKSITTFSALRNDILSELQNIEKVNGVKWTRYPLLNKLLKGHRKGELTIITGPTGSGKTTFMSEYSLDLALQGVSTLWGSFEIRNSRLASTLLRQFVGYSLENKLHEFEHWANEFERYPLYFMTFHGQQPLKVVMEAIEHAQYVHDISHVIIDNLQFMMGISASYRVDKFWEQDAIIAAFRAFATHHNVHVTLVMHPRKERDSEELTTSSVFGTAKATQEADNVLIIQDKRLTSLRGKKYLQVVKNRYSGDLGIMPLDFDKEALSYAKRKKDKDKTEATEDGGH